MEAARSVGRRKRIGMLGGTFDPPHKGHLEIARFAIEAMDVDAVVMIPAANPAFKQGSVVASIEDRLEMCRLACAGNARLSVSDVEARRNGVTYSIDTVRQLRAELGDDVQLLFLLGADAASSLPSWNEAEALASLVSFKVFPRCSDAGEDASEMLLRLESAGFDVEMVHCEVGEVSSTEVRANLACGDSVEALLPACVADYIEARGLYTGLTCALSSEFMAARRAELAQRVSRKRLQHVDGVVETAAQLARIYGVDERKASLAGLLHDWDKGYDDAGIRARVRDLGLESEIDPFIVEHMPLALHGPTAAMALSMEFPQIPADVIDAIRNHTTASAGASDLEKVLYVADGIEPSRSFGPVEELRAMVGSVSLDELFFNVYRFWTVNLIERGGVLHPDTIDIWNSLAIKYGGRKKGFGENVSAKAGKER